ncbi:MAG: hypothetical protein AB7T49_17310 [Oligoflexales bacterium]
MENIDIAFSIPHTGYMKLVDTICSVEKGSGTFVAKLSQSKPYWDAEGNFCNHWLVEIMAQGVASLFFCNKSEANEDPSVGFLLSIDQCRLTPGMDLQVDDQLVIKANLIHNFYPLGVYKAQVLFDGEEIACAEMKFLDNREEG